MHKRGGSGTTAFLCLPNRSRLNLDLFWEFFGKGIFLATFHTEFYWIVLGFEENPIRNVAQKIQYETSPHDTVKEEKRQISGGTTASRAFASRGVACSRGWMPRPVHEGPPPERMRETYSERPKLNLNLNLDRVPAVAASRQQVTEVMTRLHRSGPHTQPVNWQRAPEGDSNIRVGNDGSAFDSHSPRESATDDYTHTHTRESATRTIPPFQRAEGGPRSDVSRGGGGRGVV
jgi:hypothetical protein